MMTQILLSYYQKYPLVFEYFNFLRDLFLALQILIVIFISFHSRNFRYFIYYFSIFISAFLLAIFFNTYFPSPRPIGGLDSFPSKHTLISSSLSFGLIFQDLKFGLLSFALTILIALFSFLSLKHWPIDILFGFLFGFLIFFILQKSLNLFNRFNSNQQKNKG
jgi:membrane-associated phospholipid phosphatase